MQTSTELRLIDWLNGAVRKAKGLLDDEEQRPDVAVYVVIRERKDEDPLNFDVKVFKFCKLWPPHAKDLAMQCRI